MGWFNELNINGGGSSNPGNFLNWVYPVGSIYMSTNSVNPGILFGGTWEQISGQFLLGAGEDYSLGETGGEATHILTTNEMPSHNHVFSGIATNSGAQSVKHSHVITVNSGGSHYHTGPDSSQYYVTRGSEQAISGMQEGGFFNDTGSTGGVRRDHYTASAGSHTHTASSAQETTNHSHSITPKGNIGNTGGNKAHNNMPPYLVVNIWQRSPKFDFLQNLCYNIIKKKKQGG